MAPTPSPPVSSDLTTEGTTPPPPSSEVTPTASPAPSPRKATPSLPSSMTPSSLTPIVSPAPHRVRRGGMLKGIPTSDVLRLDCRTHTWRRVPSMGVARACAAAAVVDGKIYVVGGFDDSLSWGEVFDPKTQAWESLPWPR
ncbi:unnamed protein product, partial [Brassica rapa subsp. trilocularis]